MSSPLHDVTLGQIVAEDYRAGAVFDRFGLDFCCRGNRTLGDACAAKGIDETTVTAALAVIGKPNGRAAGDLPTGSGPLDELTRYVVSRHHAYVRQATPRIVSYLERLIEAHGERHPELTRVAGHFSILSADMAMHMIKEEEILFPYICALSAAKTSGAQPDNLFGTIRHPIQMMEDEHQAAGDELAAIGQLTSGYAVPADGCATYRVCFEELEAFTRDLHQHIHIENNVLFPRAIALEEEMLTSGGRFPA